MKKAPIQKIALGGVLAALVWLFTYSVKIPIPATSGYVHPGDGVILLSGMLLGPLAWLPAGLGSALSDLLGGYTLFIAPTFFIKGLMGLVAGRFAKRQRLLFNAFLFAAAEALMVAGYLLFEGFTFGWPAALSSVLPNVLQGVAGVFMGSALCAAFRNAPL